MWYIKFHAIIQFSMAVYCSIHVFSFSSRFPFLSCLHFHLLARFPPFFPCCALLTFSFRRTQFLFSIDIISIMVSDVMQKGVKYAKSKIRTHTESHECTAPHRIRRHQTLSMECCCVFLLFSYWLVLKAFAIFHSSLLL